MEFITIPDTYYDNLRERLQTSCTKILEDIEILQKLHILVDYDEEGYLLQVSIFTILGKRKKDQLNNLLFINKKNRYSLNHFKIVLLYSSK